MSKVAEAAMAADLATDKQLDYIVGLCDRLGRPEPRGMATLTKRQASELIDKLKDEVDETMMPGNGFWDPPW